MGWARRLLAIMVLGVGFVGCAASSGSRKEMIGSEAPFLRYTLLDGSWHSSEELRGKRVVIAFWASWCSFSRPVIEQLNQLADRFKSRKDVEFLAVSIDIEQDYEKLSERIRYGKLDSLTHVFSGLALLDDVFVAYMPTALPHLFVIDKGGTVVAEGHTVSVVEEALGGVG